VTKKVGDWMKPETLMASVMRRINKTETCWLWTGQFYKHGYGRATRPHGSKGQVKYERVMGRYELRLEGA
jgi:hypothetical protein